MSGSENMKDILAIKNLVVLRNVVFRHFNFLWNIVQIECRVNMNYVD